MFLLLSENRPYRQLLPVQAIEKIMREMVANRKLDGCLVADLFSDAASLKTLTGQIGEISWTEESSR